ncbi:MAG: hypothetical protein WEC12_02205 [Balneolaceae bacterium]
MEHFIRKNFPDAEKGRTVTETCIEKLVNRYGFNLGKTLLATSVCSDEIVNTATNFRSYLNRESPFQLGGLAGYPFAGLTGFQAFAAHIPDNGFAIIQYGPHIGVSKNGEVGKMHRAGQKADTSCCGALQASLKAFEKHQGTPADSELDYQLWKIENSLSTRRENIMAHDVPLVAATEVMFGIIRDRVNRLTEASGSAFEGIRVAFIGGVIINTDYNLPDWFDLRHFEVI